jgi:hypothetical protein
MILTPRQAETMKFIEKHQIVVTLYTGVDGHWENFLYSQNSNSKLKVHGNTLWSLFFKKSLKQTGKKDWRWKKYKISPLGKQALEALDAD